MKKFINFSVIVIASIIQSACGNSNSTNASDTIYQVETEKTDVGYEDSRIKYDSSLALSGWVALYDKNKRTRCYMSHDDYYSIKEPSMNGNLKEEYSFLTPLGMVLKYSGANIIWGFDGIESVSWYDAIEYVDNYSPDGNKWRLLSKIEASAICSNIYNFTNNFGKYYPNDLTYLGAYRSINTWTSGKSDEKWLRNADSKAYNKIYTLDISGDEGRIQNEFTEYEKDFHNVYPITAL